MGGHERMGISIDAAIRTSLRHARIILAAIFLANVAACKQKPPPDQPSHTPPRTDFSPEEFGIGRKHTPDVACNREIDQMIEQVRVCYNTRPTAQCDTLRSADSAKIARLKNSQRCSR